MENTKKIDRVAVGSDFSGVGAFDQALKRLGVEYETVFACDMDKYARQTYLHNYGEPRYYPENVYDREIPEESLDIYMTSPPCQSFSLAGKRKGEEDKRGILFYNSHEFIQKNKPRYFIFENVKGLLSDDGGRTFGKWCGYLGGKSVNGNPVIFPHPESVPYHIYWKVLNAKDFGVPQNRERVFVVGIRDDADNDFTWPRPFPLEKRLKDVLEEEVDEKYFLSDEVVSKIITDNINTDHLFPKDVSNTIRVGGGGSLTEKHAFDMIKVVGNVNPSGNGMNGNVFDEQGISPSLTTNKGEGIKIKSATKKGYEVATEGDSINFSVPNSETRRGRVGKSAPQTLDTQCNQAVMIAAMRGRNPDNPIDRTAGAPTEQKLEVNKNGTSNTITSVQKDNLVILHTNPVVEYQLKGGKWDKTHEQSGRVYDKNGVAPTIHTMGGGNQEPKIFHSQVVQLKDEPVVCEQRTDEGLRFFKDNVCGAIRTTGDGGDKRIISSHRIRRLTPRECFRLMDFDESFTWPVSDSQAYKQAGNSIVVEVLAQLISRLKLGKSPCE